MFYISDTGSSDLTSHLSSRTPKRGSKSQLVLPDSLFLKDGPPVENKTLHVVPKLSMTFQAEAWNAQDKVGAANCLAYALDQPDLAWPYLNSLRSPHKTDRQSHSALYDYVDKMRNDFSGRDRNMRDLLSLAFGGLERIAPHQHSPDKRHIIAFSPYMGHFLRLDGNNVWSHKSGQSMAKTTDDKGCEIVDLGRASFKAFANHSDAKKTWAEAQSRIKEFQADETLDAQTLQIMVRSQKMSQKGSAATAGVSEANDFIYLALPKEGIFVHQNKLNHGDF